MPRQNSSTLGTDTNTGARVLVGRAPRQLLRQCSVWEERRGAALQPALNTGRLALWLRGCLQVPLCAACPATQMAASPIPHFLQPRFTAARKQLLLWLRQAHQEGLLQGAPVSELLDK